MNREQLAAIEQLYRVYSAGFRDGRHEQLEQDFPDVGMRFDKPCEAYWKEYVDQLGLNNGIDNKR